MKYLKTYEDFNRELIQVIKTWLQHNDLDYVKLNNIKIESSSFGTSIYDSISKEDDDYSLNYQFNEQNYSSPFSIWSGWGAKQIWNYLDGLTQEEIEEQRASNEAHKFNF